MSENKYIIDKDSLTGIADAVRNKLGAGEATTDSQTGDIIYPKDKGYYLKQGRKLAGFIYPNTSSSHYTSSELISVSHATILELCGGINPSFIKFTVLTKGDSNSSYRTASQTLYNGVYFYSGEITNSTTLLNNVVGATKTFAYTGQGCYITGASGSYSAGGWNPNYYSFYSFPGVLQIEFLNENQQNIEAAIDGPIAGTSRYTMEIPNGEVSTKIPFSIDDIQDRITNYLVNPSSLIGHEGLSYGYLTIGGSSFYSSRDKNCFLTFIPLNTGQKIGFCIGETVSNRLRAGFFSGKTYNNFSQYVENSFSKSQIYSDGISITGDTELSGDGLLKRFYYTAPSDGMLVVSTSSAGTLAYLHVWEATE